jgi:hypothetical protein
MAPEVSLVPADGRTESMPLTPFQPERYQEVAVSPFVRVPGWSRLAADRELALRSDTAEARIEWLGRFVLMPGAAGSMAFVALTLTLGWVVAIAFAVVATGALLGVMRLPATQRWRLRQEAMRRDHEAVRTRSRLVTLMHREERAELERLSLLVENVREHERLRRCGQPAVLETRLDAILLSYVDRAIELRGVSAAFSATRSDEPGLPRLCEVLDEHEPETKAEQDRAFRIFHLRESARNGCRRRIRRLRAELETIGQLVRLVHEQTFCSRLPCHELSELLADVLDEAELTREAGEEAALAMADVGRGRAFEPALNRTG